VSGIIAAIADGWIVDRLVPIDFTASASASDSIDARMNFSFDSMPKRAVEQWVSGHWGFGKTWAAAAAASTRVAA
jgi:hypothetical protein